ncbi:hypothetical protein [Nodosilinea nodulosa]|uniref:hypothetical protein n=1 Tax=Nodosilinea nodulosa TaxID=416001 RepID=UPI00036E4D07|nr:hypothetical protein [Nodosilinea nodulosa]
MQDKSKSITLGQLEYWAKVVAIAGAILTAAIGVYQLSASVSQSRAELAWRKAEMSRQIMTEFQASSAAQSLLMMDYEDSVREFTSAKGESFLIGANDVYAALEKDDAELTAKDFFIIDRFDELLYFMGQLEAAANSGLVDVRDVRYPLSWYVKQRFCPQKSQIEAYIMDYAAPETLAFLEGLPEWQSCSL